MGKTSRIDTFFKRKNVGKLEVEASSLLTTPNIENLVSEDRPVKSPRIEINGIDTNTLERDPGIRKQIWEYPIDQRDEIRRAYIKFGPYQCILSKYPKSGRTTHERSFQSSWFQLHPTWLEYSPNKDAAFCLPCYLFSNSAEDFGQNAFIGKGFQNWKNIKKGFLNHMGKDHNSTHYIAQNSCDDLMCQPQHIRRSFENFTSQQIENNRLRLKASIDAIRWLSLQGCPFRGHDERKGSRNRGNFLQMINILASYNKDVRNVVLENAPKNASYTSPEIQKEILHILSAKIKKAIRDEIGDAKFCIIVDDARDESKKEQMSIVLRFVNKDGFVLERFFGLLHVPDTAALTLKNGIFFILSHNNLDFHNIRGQGYDGASNMSGEWNGLQALISKECPYAYYIHCLAHRLQLALVAATREVSTIDKFFTRLSFIVNIVGASCKRNDELKASQALENEYMISIDELETVLLKIMEEGSTSSQRGEADAAYEVLTSFEFVLILHLMKAIMEITDLLCQALQCQSQDILNAIHLVSSTKILIQKLRDDGWDNLLSKVKIFCEMRNIDVPNLNAHYVARGGRARHQQGEITIEHHYRVDIFYAAIDSQLQELSIRFNEKSVELLNLSIALDPRDWHTALRIDDICNLVDKFYPQDFEDIEKSQLRIELQHYEHLQQHLDFQKLSTMSDLCQWLVKTRKSKVYPLTYRLITLVLTLPVSTATTERSFSAMNIVKTRLRNKMDDDFLADSLIVYIEKEIAETFSTESIIDDFHDLKERRVPLR